MNSVTLDKWFLHKGIQLQMGRLSARNMCLHAIYLYIYVYVDLGGGGGDS